MTYPTSSRRPLAKWMVGLALLTSSGCLPHVAEQTTKTPFPSRSERATASTSKREAEPTVTTEVSGNVVTVNVEQTTECQEQRHTPMEEETVTERHLESGGVAQAINIGAAAVLVGSGIAIYSAGGSDCTTTPEASAANPQPAARPCTADERATTKRVGIALSSTAVVPLGLFVWNIFRGKDSKEIVKGTPKEEASGWMVCAHKPIANANLVMSFSGGVQKPVTTDATGTTVVNLATLDLPAKAFGSPEVSVSIQGLPSKPATFSMAMSPTFTKRTEWETKDEQTIARSCGQYLEWRVYADYLVNNTARREFYKDGGVPRADEFCNILYVMKKCPDYIEDPERRLCGKATFNDVVLSGMAEWGSQRKLLDQADYDATFKVKVLVKDSAKDPTLARRISTIRSMIQKDTSANTHSYHVPPGTMGDLQRVAEVLPAFRARAGEQDETMNFQESVIREFKECVQRCVQGSANLPGCRSACQKPGTAFILQQSGLIP